MRITGGRFKGRGLAALHGTKIRPTSDKVRESIFNILGQDLKGLWILDLFAGAGTLGLESLSRGAEGVFFVDIDGSALRLIKKNLTLCDDPDSARLIKKDLAKGLPGELKGTGLLFDVVFMDPPYAQGQGYIPVLIKELSESGLLHTNSVVIAETPSKEDPPDVLSRLKSFNRREYGDTSIIFYGYEVAQNEQQ